MTDWRLAGSLIELRNQVNAAFPHRSTASDGTIGDSAHQAEGNKSDHNPWVKDNHGIGVVRAFDITHDPAHGVDTYALAERMRQHQDNRVSYIISNRRITGPTHGWKWATYTGTSDPHTNHMHVSVSTTQVVYDNARPWGGITAATPTPPEDDMALSNADIEYQLERVPAVTVAAGRVSYSATNRALNTTAADASGKALAALQTQVDAVAARPVADVKAAVEAALQDPEVLAGLRAALLGGGTVHVSGDLAVGASGE